MACYPRPKTRGEAAAWIDLVAIIHPENTASRRVAEKIGLRFEKTVGAGAYARSVFGANI
jgi:RimJ/RimL family protein N-acetyltransferase